MLTLRRPIAALLALATATPLGAQRGPVRRPPPIEFPRTDTVPRRARPTGIGHIDGLVTDTSLVPIEGADVAIVRTSVHVGTLASGRFRILKVPAGQYIVIVRKLGFHPTSGLVEVTANDTLRLSYTLERLAQGLDTAKIVEQRQSLRMLEFDYRRKLGPGEFITQEEIEKHNSVFATELIRTLRGFDIRMVPGGGGQMRYLLAPKAAGTIIGKCEVQVYLDGVHLPDGINLDDLPSPRNLAGIEAYSGPARIPPQWSGTGSACGVVLLWTKDGG